jgi:hypothetical protein
VKEVIISVYCLLLQPPFNDEIHFISSCFLISLRSVAVGQSFLYGQSHRSCSLKRLIAQEPQGHQHGVVVSSAFIVIIALTKTDSSLIIAQEAIQLSQKLNFTKERYVL